MNDFRVSSMLHPRLIAGMIKSPGGLEAGLFDTLSKGFVLMQYPDSTDQKVLGRAIIKTTLATVHFFYHCGLVEHAPDELVRFIKTSTLAFSLTESIPYSWGAPVNWAHMLTPKQLYDQAQAHRFHGARDKANKILSYYYSVTGGVQGV